MPTLTDAQQKMADIVASVARRLGVDPELAVATAYKESGLNPTAEGDKQNGRFTSFGLFQLHEGGHLTSAGITREQAFDPVRNTEIALKPFASLQGKYSGGTLAAKSQRPANAGAYASDVDALVAGPLFDRWASTSGPIAPVSSVGTPVTGTSASSDTIKLFSLGSFGDVSLPKSGTTRLGVIIFGFLLVVVALHALTSNATTPVGVVAQGGSNAGSKAVRHVRSVLP